jgi:hypothetical protein
VFLAASGGNLQSDTAEGGQDGVNIYRFYLEKVSLVGSGRLAGSTSGLLDLSVSETAHVLIRLPFPGGVQWFEGSAVPTFRLNSDGECPSGQRLTTTFVLALEYLGKTSVTETHCTLAGS